MSLKRPREPTKQRWESVTDASGVVHPIRQDTQNGRRVFCCVHDDCPKYYVSVQLLLYHLMHHSEWTHLALAKCTCHPGRVFVTKAHAVTFHSQAPDFLISGRLLVRERGETEFYVETVTTEDKKKLVELKELDADQSEAAASDGGVRSIKATVSSMSETEPQKIQESIASVAARNAAFYATIPPAYFGGFIAPDGRKLKFKDLKQDDTGSAVCPEPDCGVVFATKPGMTRHVVTAHNWLGNATVACACSVCDGRRVFINAGHALERHNVRSLDMYQFIPRLFDFRAPPGALAADTEKTIGKSQVLPSLPVPLISATKTQSVSPGINELETTSPMDLPTVIENRYQIDITI